MNSHGMVWLSPIGPMPLNVAEAAPVNLFEANNLTNQCVEASTSFGSLIQATAGIAGGTGSLEDVPIGVEFGDGPGRVGSAAACFSVV